MNDQVDIGGNIRRDGILIVVGVINPTGVE